MNEQHAAICGNCMLTRSKDDVLADNIQIPFATPELIEEALPLGKHGLLEHHICIKGSIPQPTRRQPCPQQIELVYSQLVSSCL
jgi:hypothetical protein